MKKVLSLVLVIAMVLSSMSVAFAGTFEDVVDSDYATAIETMKALGVIDGFPDGTFRPEGALTRAQLAKLLVEALGFGGLAGGASNFSDTNGHWADGYIAIATGMGLVNGYPDGSFKPEGPVKYEEAYAMVLRALGYTDASLRGVWPTNYMVKALDLGLTKKLASTTGPADRGGVAQVLYNALEAKFVIVDADNNITPVKEGALTLIDRLGKENKGLEVDLSHLDPEDKNYKGNVVDLTPYMYQTINVYENKDGDVIYVKSVDSLVLEGTVTATTTGSITVEDANEKEHKINTTGTAIKTYFNGVENQKTNSELKDAKVTVVINDVNGNEKFDATKDFVEAVVATKATGERQINRVYVDGKLKLDTIALPENDDEVDFDNLVIKGDATKLGDIKKDSVVTLYEGKDGTTLVKLTLVVSNDTVEGRISKTNTAKDVITVDGKAYDVSAFASSNSDLKAGSEGIFFLNADGEIFAFEKEGTGVPKNYAVITAMAAGTYVEGFGVEKDAQVKLATEAGKIITYKVDEDSDALEDPENGKIDFVEKLKIDLVVEYDLTKDGKIDSLTPVDFDGNTGKSFTPKNKSFVLADDAVIFDKVTKNSAKKYEYGVLTVEQLDQDSITADVVYNTDGEIELLVVTDGVVLEQDGTYAIITGVELTVNDDNEDVYLLTAWVDGVKTSYLSTKKFREVNVTPSALRSGEVLREVNIKDGAISGFEDELVTKKGLVADVNTSRELIKIGSTWYGLADDAVIYLQTGTNAVRVADIYEIEDTDTVKLYNTNPSDGDDIEYVLILKR